MSRRVAPNMPCPNPPPLHHALQRGRGVLGGAGTGQGDMATWQGEREGGSEWDSLGRTGALWSGVVGEGAEALATCGHNPDSAAGISYQV